ncbi:hypothetical protein VQ03_19585 [Methylobacterium tarhaniae]|uniref:Uncharacterized protein n=1 Tax=Methylobacterium tarhaniae TaxID=1187852 RepID=A0A0J6VDS6_9HYPH|nr:hypothetical protein VQ03_19585 [Methylobacterium tarhaniae]
MIFSGLSPGQPCRRRRPAPPLTLRDGPSIRREPCSIVIETSRADILSGPMAGIAVAGSAEP